MLSPSQQPRQRCSDDDRRRTARLLSEALAKGQLDLTEFDERSASTFNSTYRDELVPLVEDLLPRPEQALFGNGSGHQTAGLSPSTSRTLDRVNDLVTGQPGTSGLSLAVFGGATRKNWVVPAQHASIALFGGTEVDLTTARFNSQDTHISAHACFGGVDVIVPEGFRISVDGLGIFGGYDTKVEKGAIDPSTLPDDAPTIRISGLALFGGVTVKVVKSTTES